MFGDVGNIFNMGSVIVDINTGIPQMLEKDMLYQALSQLRKFRDRLSTVFIESVADGQRFPPIFDSFFTDVENLVWANPEEGSSVQFSVILNIYVGLIKVFMMRQMVNGKAYAAMIDNLVAEQISTT